MPGRPLEIGGGNHHHREPRRRHLAAYSADDAGNAGITPSHEYDGSRYGNRVKQGRLQENSQLISIEVRCRLHPTNQHQHRLVRAQISLVQYVSDRTGVCHVDYPLDLQSSGGVNGSA